MAPKLPSKQDSPNLYFNSLTSSVVFHGSYDAGFSEGKTRAGLTEFQIRSKQWNHGENSCSEGKVARKRLGWK